MRFLLVAVLGAALAVLTAAALGTAFDKAMWLTGATGAGALGAGAVGALVLHSQRKRTIATQSTIVTLTSVAAVAAGAMTAGTQMLASPRPLTALLVVLMSASTVGVLISLVLGDRVGAASQALTVAARRIGDGDLRTPVEEPPTQELADLANELERMSVRLAEARGDREALESSRRDLVAWISHDLRTPIARIRAIAEGLEEGVIDGPSEQADYWSRLRAEVDRLARLVDDLFALSQINAGLLALDLEPVSLGDLVSDVASAAAAQAEARQVQLQVRLHSDTQLLLSVAHMERVLGNLLDNAVRFTPAGRAVHVEVRTGEGAASVAVCDACGGIPEEDLGNLFDVGWSRERSGPRGDGAGLGLVIARGIVEAHGGRISAENREPGCRFEVRLPTNSLPRGRTGSPRPTPS